MREKVRELLTALLAMPDGSRIRETCVCIYLARRLADAGFSLGQHRTTYRWSGKHAEPFCPLGPDGGRQAFIDNTGTLTPKRREFVEFLLTKLEELPE